MSNFKLVFKFLTLVRSVWYGSNPRHDLRTSGQHHQREGTNRFNGNHSKKLESFIINNKLLSTVKWTSFLELLPYKLWKCDLKIYVFLWFWLIILSCMTVISLVRSKLFILPDCQIRFWFMVWMGFQNAFESINDYWPVFNSCVL